MSKNLVLILFNALRHQARFVACYILNDLTIVENGGTSVYRTQAAEKPWFIRSLLTRRHPR